MLVQGSDGYGIHWLLWYPGDRAVLLSRVEWNTGMDQYWNEPFHSMAAVVRATPLYVYIPCQVGMCCLLRSLQYTLLPSLTLFLGYGCCMQWIDHTYHLWKAPTYHHNACSVHCTCRQLSSQACSPQSVTCDSHCHTQGRLRRLPVLLLGAWLGSLAAPPVLLWEPTVGACPSHCWISVPVTRSMSALVLGVLLDVSP